MAECGHCGKHVKGIRDHIEMKHGDHFYEMGPDNRYYSYKFLRDTAPGLVIVKPHWDSTYK
jgi:hypothetical protein